MLRAIGSSDNSSGGKTRRSGRGAGNGRGGAVSRLSNTALLMHFSGVNNEFTPAPTDSSSYARTVTIVNPSTFQYTNVVPSAGFGPTSGFFNDGVNTVLTVPDSETLELGSDDFCIEMFGRNGLPASLRIFLDKRDADGLNLSFALTWHTGTSEIGVYMSSDGLTWQLENMSSGAGTAAHSTWYHIAVTRSGNTIRLFIDGVEKNQGTFTGSVYNNGKAWCIGAGSTDGTVLPFSGRLDELRISIGVPVYTSNFTPPTAEFSP